jgi:transposase
MRENDSRKLSDEALSERHRQVVECLNRGMTQVAAGLQCGMSEKAVNTLFQRYKQGGMKAVLVKRNGRPVGKGRDLSKEEERDIQRLICDKTPDQLKMPYALWNRNAVKELIENRCGRKLAVRTVGNYLKRWGFTPQKPLHRAYEQRPAEVLKWREEQYPAIQARAAKEGAEINWGDETGLRSDDVRGRSYAPKGSTPEIRVNSKRHGCSVMSTVTNKGKMRWMVFQEGMNSKIFIGFLKRLIKGPKTKKKIFLILDNLRVHHSKPVKEWVAKNSKAIELFFLPSYSPELNPVELANSQLKGAVTAHAPARRKGQLEAVAIKFLRSIQRRPLLIVSWFQKESVRYAA